jgi:hypothetical protein
MYVRLVRFAEQRIEEALSLLTVRFVGFATYTLLPFCWPYFISFLFFFLYIATVCRLMLEHVVRTTQKTHFAASLCKTRYRIWGRTLVEPNSPPRLKKVADDLALEFGWSTRRNQITI